MPSTRAEKAAADFFYLAAPKRQRDVGLQKNHGQIDLAEIGVVVRNIIYSYREANRPPHIPMMTATAIIVLAEAHAIQIRSAYLLPTP